MQIYIDENGCRARIDTHDKEAYISDVFVPINLRCQGLGRRIVEKALTIARALGITKVVLHTDHEAMFLISESLDFVHTCTERHYEWTE